VASNYRAALRGKSRADFINKITVVLEEAVELTKIFSATRRTARNHKS